MSKEIKTRQVHKDIKALDKTVTGMERVKRAYVRTKDSAKQTQVQPYDTPEEYAGDKITHGADNAAHETVRQITKQGGRGIDHVKEKKQVSDSVKQVKSGMKKFTSRKSNYQKPQGRRQEEKRRRNKPERGHRRRKQWRGRHHRCGNFPNRPLRPQSGAKRPSRPPIRRGGRSSVPGKEPSKSPAGQ